ncbi:hypothetical protein CASFOL_019254 [Castilleja foliolosa]|uniref:Uncharacterized protein n=1 Tax=Castilleja foliolosa TaxID=1961234 RepID=A0ABD3D7P9_9LAMI
MENHTAAAKEYSDDIDSCCSTPYASAPSSPGRATHLAGYYYSAPASPTHFVISTANLNPYPSAATAAPHDASSSFEFDFSATCTPAGGSSPEAMTCADELFCNGQIRPLKLSTHLRRPQSLAPLIESDAAADAAEENCQAFPRGRELRPRAGSLRRRTRSMSPIRLIEAEAAETTSFQRQNEEILLASSNLKGEGNDESAPPYASRSSSAGRSSRRWVFLKEFLYRSKSEGRRNEGHNGKFWGSLSFSPVKDSKKTEQSKCRSGAAEGKTAAFNNTNKNNNSNKNGAAGKRRGGPSPSAHELHYTKNRAQSEEMRKKTFLPYRPGLLGCLGFSSKSYGAINGFARALNPVSSR